MKFSVVKTFYILITNRSRLTIIRVSVVKISLMLMIWYRYGLPKICLEYQNLKNGCDPKFSEIF